MTRHRWTVEDRERALALYDTEGPREASRQTGVPFPTIGRWAKETGRSGTFRNEETRQATETIRVEVERRLAEFTLDLSETLRAARQRIHDAATREPTPEEILEAIQGDKAVYRAYMEGRRESSAAKDWAVVLGICFDKLQLATGKPTSRNEDVTVHAMADEIVAGLEDAGLQGEARDRAARALGRRLRSVG